MKTEKMFNELLCRAESFERTGHRGFLIQQYIESSARVLRVVVMGKKNIVYWKIQPDSETFGEHLVTGAYIEEDVDSVYASSAIELTGQFCAETGINLAGFDLIFDRDTLVPFLLEINYFFGRRGLGGSEQYYELLCFEIKKWLNSLGLSVIGRQL